MVDGAGNMESSVHTSTFVKSSPNTRLKAAHLAISKHLAALSSRSPAATAFHIETSAPIFFDDDGRKASVSLFDLHTLVDGLMKNKQASEAHKGTSGVTIHLTASGLHGLKVFRETLAPPARPTITPCKKPATLISRDSLYAMQMGARIRDQAIARARQIAETKASEEKIRLTLRSHASATVFKDETLSGRFLLPMMRSMLSGVKSVDAVLKDLCRVTGTAYGSVDTGFKGGDLTLRAMTENCLRFLISRQIVVPAGQNYGLTLEGRGQAEAGKSPVDPSFRDPEVSVVVKPVAPQARGVRREMSEVEMKAMLDGLEKKTPFQILVMWKNALSIIADPFREQEHLQANVLLRGVQAKWNQQSAAGEVGMMFRWPQIETRAADHRNEDADHSHFEGLERVGMLAYLGYKVGNDGLSAPVRRKLLTEVFARALPPAFQREYMDQWGEPGTAQRLRKMADCIASFARNASRKDADFGQAIQQWEDDLAYLRDRHYQGTFGFAWPSETRNELGMAASHAMR